jgi:hypothetical protein
MNLSVLSDEASGSVSIRVSEGPPVACRKGILTHSFRMSIPTINS